MDMKCERQNYRRSKLGNVNMFIGPSYTLTSLLSPFDLQMSRLFHLFHFFFKSILIIFHFSFC